MSERDDVYRLMAADILADKYGAELYFKDFDKAVKTTKQIAEDRNFYIETASMVEYTEFYFEVYNRL